MSVILKHDARTGIQRVVRAIWLNIKRRQPGHRFTVRPVFATARHGYRFAPEDFLDRPLDGAFPQGADVDVASGDIFLGLDLAAHILPRHERQISEWKQRGVSVHMLVYDLLPVTGKRWFNWRTRRNFARWLAFIARHADQTICISNHVASELAQWMAPRQDQRARPLRIARVRLGSDIADTAPTAGMAPEEEACLMHFCGRPFILMVGTVEPRKGYAAALKAFDRLWRDCGPEAPILVIVGKPGWKTALLQKRLQRHPESGRRLFWLRSTSDGLLQQLYSGCAGVLLASHAEGFGLPVIEALAHKRPVLLRDIPVFREFGLDGLTYFQADRPASLATAIMEWFKDIRLRRAETHQYTAPPTWADATDDLLYALELHRVPANI